MSSYAAAGSSSNLRETLAAMRQPLTVNEVLHLLVSLSDKGSVSGTLSQLLEAANAAHAQVAKAENLLAELARREAILQQRLDTADAAIAERRAEADRQMNDERIELERRERILAAGEKRLQNIMSSAGSFLQASV